MKITMYAHASFRLEADGRTIITDPYTPGSEASGFAPINEPADIVIMSSATDSFHSDPSHITDNPVVVNVLELPLEGTEVKGVAIKPFPAMESMTFDFGRDPDANAMYLFTLGGLHVLHMGDIGNPIEPKTLDALQGQVDVMLALTGAHATIALEDLDIAIDIIKPRAVIPMHFYSPRGVLQIEPVDTFLARRKEEITRVEGPSVELTPQTLPPKTHIYVLQQSR